ncbi:MAG: 2-oxo acid dehydrogenase subunit E2 [Lentisphaerae bacterium]|nr:2-oxo acid dehydrogenase subunit E2 [Lentisphaerota bacterium]
MASAVIMPRQGQSVESCIITKWYKKVGEEVKEGDLLFSYETDKASFDEEAKVSGTLLAILAEEGDDVPVLQNVCVIGKPGEDVSAFTAQGAQAGEPAKEKAAAAPMAQAAAPAVTGQVQADERARISPRARNAAQNMNIDYTQAAPTGPNGRIIERDIAALAKSGAAKMEKTAAPAAAAMPAAPSGEEFTDVPHSNVRRMIAKAMHASLSNMAQLTHSSSFDATDILAFRKRIKENAEALSLENITLNDIVIYAVSRVLRNHPALNAHYDDDKLRVFKNVHIGMAVDTPRGLLVPTLFNANLLSLNEIARQTKIIAKEAQEGKISPDLLTGASFTISNLGALGIEHFTPVINPPQTGILGVNNIQTRVRMEGGEMKPYQAMGLSLTYDHRALDGAPASRFLQELCSTLERFSVLLAR